MSALGKRGEAPVKIDQGAAVASLNPVILDECGQIAACRCGRYLNSSAYFGQWHIAVQTNEAAEFVVPRSAQVMYHSRRRWTNVFMS